jgi:O-antigen/teichoic acid export membrane protein
MTPLRLLARDSLIYGSGVVLGRAASFLMLPIYTRLLTPADYGVLQLIQLTIDVSGILLTAGFVSAIYRYYFKTPDQKRRHAVITTALVMFGTANAVGAILLATAAPWIGIMLLAGPQDAGLIRLATAAMALEVLTIVPLTYMQIQKQAVRFTLMSLARLVLQLALNIVFLVGLGLGVRGILLSSVITAAIIGCAASAWLLRRIHFRFDSGAARSIFRFGLPYKLTTTGAFVINFSDRYFLQSLVGLSAVGLYGLAAQFSMLLVHLASQPIMQAWNPRRFEMALQPRDERDAYYDRTFLAYNLVVITSAVAIALFARPVIRIMAAPAFYQAADFVPVLVLAQVAACWNAVMSFGVELSERTKYLGYATAVAVVVLLAMHTLLIPIWGPFGAAIATAAGFWIRFFLVFRWANRLWPIRYRWRTHVRLAAYGTTAVTIGVWLGRSFEVGGQIFAAIVVFALYLAGVWFGGIVSSRNKAALIAFTRRQLQSAAV